jgi:putative copper export protein
LGLLVCAGAALLGSRFRRIRGRGVAAGLVLALLGTTVSALPATTDALTGDDLVQTLLIQVHIVAAGVWVGGVFGLGVLAVGDRRSGGVAPVWSTIWSRFSQVAAVCVGGVLISGLWLTWKHVGSPGQFLSTPYGRFLAIKITLVLIMIAAGGYNQQVLLPRIARLAARGGADAAIRHLGKVARIEAVLGGLVIMVVPFLSGSARKEAAGAPASPIDGRLLALGLLLIVVIAFGLWSAGRFARSLARVSGPVEENQA